MVNPQFLRQLAVAQHAQVPRTLRQAFNPKPPGTIAQGSTTDKVEHFFHEHAGKWFTRGELACHLKLRAKGLDWALTFLSRTGAIECGPDGTNPRYLRYRVPHNRSRMPRHTAGKRPEAN